MDTLRIIVGFRQRLVDLDDLRGFEKSEDKARAALNRAPPPGLPGFIDVLRRIPHINAVIVLIDRSMELEFLTAAPTWDPIEYCDRNVALCTASFNDNLPNQYRVGAELVEPITNFHSPVASWSAPFGLGIRVGLIDTGISPHPYLPAVSARDLEAKLSCVHESVPWNKRASLCSSLLLAEQAAGIEGIGLLPIIGKITTPPYPLIFGSSDLPREVDKAIKSHISEVWREWRQEMSDWFAKNRKPNRPELPTYRHLLGALRLLSPLSKSFLDGDLQQGILDRHGHGTRMAGAIAALRPELQQVSVAAQLSRRTPNPLMFDVVGVAPYSELVVLKCLNIADEDDTDGIEGSLVSMVNALSYCLDPGVDIDVLYIGLALKDAPLAVPMSIANLIGKLEQKGTVIFAPAGNKGQSTNGLMFPASLSSVHAVTGIAIDQNTGDLDLCSYSNIANIALHEETTFCAYAGTDDAQVITTDPVSGFAADFGTSIAAAIATGCYSAAASALYMRGILREYELLIQPSGQFSLDHVERTMTNWRESDAQRAALLQVMKGCAASIQGFSQGIQTAEFGYGVIRVPDPTTLP